MTKGSGGGGGGGGGPHKTEKKNDLEICRGRRKSLSRVRRKDFGRALRSIQIRYKEPFLVKQASTKKRRNEANVENPKHARNKNGCTRIIINYNTGSLYGLHCAFSRYPLTIFGSCAQTGRTNQFMLFMLTVSFTVIYGRS